MKRGIRRKEGEDFSAVKLEQVISGLNQEKPITKKAACEILNITYNTTRLAKIIQEYEERKEYTARKRKELKNKPLSKEDESYIVSSYLETENLSEISDITFRSTSVIKNTLQKYNVALRSTENNYFNPVFLEENAVADDYIKDDLVYSARYTQPAKIKEKFAEGVYSIWLCKDNQFAYQPYYELGDLRPLQKELSIKIEDFPPEEAIQLLNEALIKSRKRKKDA